MLNRPLLKAKARQHQRRHVAEGRQQAARLDKSALDQPLKGGDRVAPVEQDQNGANQHGGKDG